MRRSAQHHRTETRSIQRSVQILLTVCGIAFLLAGMVLAVSGASVSSAVGSVSDRIDDARQPTDDDATDSDSADAGGETDTDGSGGTDDETGETNDADNTDSQTDGTDDSGSQTDGTDDTNGNDENSTDDSNVLTAVVESQNGDAIDNATVTVESESGSTVSNSVDDDGETEFELEDGEYTVVADDVDGYTSENDTVAIDGDDEEITLTLESQESTDDSNDDSGGSLAVTVEDENGTAIENATVEVTEDTALLGSSEEKEVDDDGEATFDLEDGEYTVVADDVDGYTSENDTVTIDGDDKEITLTLEPKDN
ncbi:carboxypeptidase regulatory-like domain-containing protein [Haloarchaeobius amylolyticus]|uniref:Carboxypeptidase regulatory-like domain-containing protein n=1 Tax=Haloarchaeobius amylolyticus TaxID=1198296 RepID=A0ABD6BGN6_9EURY